MKIDYRKMLRDSVSALDEFDGGSNRELVPEIHEEINAVYEDRKLLQEIVGIMNNNFLTKRERFVRVKRLTDEYQMNIFNNLYD